MSESKTSVTALVTVTLRVQLTQPWGGDCTLEQVQKQATREALDRVKILNYPNSHRQIGQGDGDVTVGEVRSCRIIFNEEKL